MLLRLNKIALIGLINILLLSPAFSQSATKDFLLISQASHQNLQEENSHSHSPRFLISSHPSPIVKYNPLALTMGGLMWIYQAVLTEQMSSTCIYSPTCSSYSKSLIQDFGFARGIIFTADRLTRCNRLALYDYPLGEIDQQMHTIRQNTDYYRLIKK